MIVRGPRKDRGFTILDNAAIRDGRLSFKARGIYAFVMSQREGYGISAEELARVSREGRDAIRTGLTELVDAGYLVRSRERKADGTFATVNTLHETPISGEPTADNPSPVPPAETDETAGQTDDGFSEGGEAVSKYQELTTKNQKDRKARASARPSTWAPHQRHREKAKQLDVDVEHEAEQFQHFHDAKGSRFVDWDAAFYTWLGNAGTRFRSNVAPLRRGTRSDHWAFQ